MDLISKTKSSKKEKIQLELNAEMLAKIRGYFERATNDDIALFIEETVRSVFKREGDEAHDESFFEQEMAAMMEEQKVENLIAIIQNNLSPNMKGKLISLSAKLFEQGVRKGLYQGELKGKLEIASRMRAEGSDPVFIEKITGLSLGKIINFRKNYYDVDRTYN